MLASRRQGGASAPDPPRVLLLIKGLGLGGAERLVVGLAAHRDSARFTYEAAFVLAGQRTMVPALSGTGIDVHCLGAAASSDLRWMSVLRKMLLARRFAIVHCHLPYTASLARLVVRTLPAHQRPLVVYTEHSLWNRAAVLTRILNRATCSLDAALLVVSPTARAALPRSLRAKAEVVVHGVDLAQSARLRAQRIELRRSVRAELGVPESDVMVLTVAGLRAEKGLDVLVAAAAQVVSANEHVHFVLAGSGPLDHDVRAEVARRKLPARFQMLGQRDDALRLMVGADVFVLPSRQEGMPVALIEAMSVECAVVATAVGGVPDLVTNGADGLVVPPDRADALAAAVVELATDEKRRAKLAASARRRAEEFDIASAGRQIEAIYADLLAAASPKPESAGATVPLVVHVVPTAVARGAQREARALADGLATLSGRRHLVISLFAGPKEIPMDVTLGHRARPGHAARGLQPLLVLRLRRLLRTIGPAVVVAHGGDALKYVVPAARRRLPVVYYAIGTFGAAGNAARVRAWRRLLHRADVVACEGDEVMTECRGLLAVPPERLVLTPNGRDATVFHPGANAECEVDHRHPCRPVVLFVGALTTGKGPDRFIETVAELRRGEHALDAVAVGNGELRASLVGQAQKAEVELRGAVHDVASVMREADILVFPSRPTGEGMPGVLIEAGLTGLPVVATDVPGVKAIVEDGVTGLVVPVDDQEALTAAVSRLLGDPALRSDMGRAARAHCLERFGIDAVVRTWDALLEPLVAASLSPSGERNGRGTRPGSAV